MVPPISKDTIVVINHRCRHSHQFPEHSPLHLPDPSPVSSGRRFILKKVHPQAERIKTRERREGGRRGGWALNRPWKWLDPFEVNFHDHPHPLASPQLEEKKREKRDAT